MTNEATLGCQAPERCFFGTPVPPRYRPLLLQNSGLWPKMMKQNHANFQNLKLAHLKKKKNVSFNILLYLLAVLQIQALYMHISHTNTLNFTQKIFKYTLTLRRR